QLLDTDDEVLCLAATADGKKIAAGACDRLVRVWDLAGGYPAAKLEQTIENHADWVQGVAFTPDGQHLLTASRDKTAKVWDLATKESVLTFPDHQNGVNGVAIRNDGKAGFSIGEDKNVRMWNSTGDGKQIRVIGSHGDIVTKLAHHAKSSLLATCGADKTVKLWNSTSGAAVKTLSGSTDWLYVVEISPDGNLVAASGYNGEVRIWKVADGKEVKVFNAAPGFVAAPTPPK